MFPNVLLSLFAAVLDSIDLVAYKRASEIAAEERLDDNFLYFFGYAVVIATFPIFFFVFPEIVSEDFPKLFADVRNVSLLFLLTIPSIVSGALWSYAYANEKISVLAPYSQLSEILTVVAGFFLFVGTPTASFVFALLALGVIFVSNYEYGKRLAFNRSCLVLSISEFFRAASVLVSAFLVVSVNPFSVIYAQCFVGIGLLAAYFGFRRFRGFRIPVEHRKTFVIGTVTSNLFWILVTGIGLYLYKEVGVVTAILLSMVSLGVGLTASYFVYGDRPKKKDVAVAVAVLLCIAAASV